MIDYKLNKKSQKPLHEKIRAIKSIEILLELESIH